MKKLLLILLALLMLVGCTPKKSVEDIPTIDEPVVPIGPVAGGWTINTELPEMNDAIFDKARKDIYGESYSPLFILGTQVVAGINYQYLCYGKAVVPDATPSFKVVTVYKGLGDDPEISILNVSDFEIKDYFEEQGETTAEGMMGGFKENEELPNFLSDEENAIFEKAFEGLDGVGYTPVAKLASQVVAGTNYAFLAMGKTMSAEPVTHLYVVNIYNDLEGNATINNICGLNLSSFNAN